MTKKLRFFLLIIYTFSACFFLYLFYQQKYTISFLDVAFFIIVLLFTGNLSLLFNSNTKILTAIILPILIPAIILYGPFWTALIALIGTSELNYKNVVWYKFLFNRSMMFIAAGTAALVYKYLLSLNLGLPFYTVPLVLGLITYFAVNNGLLYMALKFSNSKHKELSVLYFLQLTKNLVTSYFLGLIFYYGYLKFGKIFFIMAIILIYVLKDLLFSLIRQLNSYTQIVESFLKVIDSKDHYTEGHCERVARYTRELCKELALSKRKTERIVNMAKIHDIGKIYVPDQILKSNDKLSSEEYEEMKKHSFFGYELLKDIDLMKEDLEIILYHHERYDGTGYPAGKVGTDIPLGARILAICDAFDVMTSGRSYKPAMNKQEVIKDFNNCAGTQFDPRIVKAMIKIINEGKFDDSFKAEKKKLIYQPSLDLGY